MDEIKTGGIRSVEEVEALTLMVKLDECYSGEAMSISDLEYKHRGRPVFEKSIRVIAEHLHKLRGDAERIKAVVEAAKLAAEPFEGDHHSIAGEFGECESDCKGCAALKALKLALKALETGEDSK